MLATAVADLHQNVSANPGVVFEDAASEHGVSHRAVLEALTEDCAVLRGYFYLKSLPDFMAICGTSVGEASRSSSGLS